MYATTCASPNSKVARMCAIGIGQSQVVFYGSCAIGIGQRPGCLRWIEIVTLQKVQASFFMCCVLIIQVTANVLNSNKKYTRI